MIRYIKRKDLDVEKYDACIENAIQSRVYAFSWYLDIVANNWDVLVLDDYNAVMPIPWKKKYFIKYIYTPLRVLELGVFSTTKIEIDVFLIKLAESFSYASLRLNTQNTVYNITENLKIKDQQFISLNEPYQVILENYRRDRKKDIRKAINAGLKEKWGDSSDNLIQLFRENIGKRFKKMTTEDYNVMKKIVAEVILKNKGEILSIYDKNDKLVSSGFFTKNNEIVSILFSSTDLNNRKNGANTYLIDRAIAKYQKENKEFYFGGSSIESIANYFKSFHAVTANYYQMEYNNLPFFLKLIKK